MWIYEGLPVQFRNKLKKRCKRVVRHRYRVLIEAEIKRDLGEKYGEIGGAMPPVFVQKFQMQLNKKCWKSERLFIEKLVSNGIDNFFPNSVLLNRFFGDLVFPEEGIVVELDGSIHKKEDIKKRDERKDYWLTYFGYIVMRVASDDLGASDKAIADLKENLKVHKLIKQSQIRAELMPPKFRKRYGETLAR